MIKERFILLENGAGCTVQFEYQAINNWYYMISNTGYRLIKKVVGVADLAKKIKNYERRGFVVIDKIEW